MATATVSYEVKRVIPPDAQERLVRDLGLVHVRSYDDADQYLQSIHQRHREKLKTVDGTKTHCTIQYRGGIFTIRSRPVTETQAAKLLERGVLSGKRRHKNVYQWPAHPGVTVSFDRLAGGGQMHFLEVTGGERAGVVAASRALVEHGVDDTLHLAVDDDHPDAAP